MIPGGFDSSNRLMRAEDTAGYFCITLWPKYELIWFKLFPKVDRSLWI